MARVVRSNRLIVLSDCLIVLHDGLGVLLQVVCLPALDHDRFVQDCANIVEARDVRLWVVLAVTVAHRLP